jgi:beta-ketoacyl-acyl-carrier-protein synthase II
MTSQAQHDCRHCGGENPAIAAYCMRCGQPLSADAGAPLVRPRRVVITGLGAITSLAPTACESWERIVSGETGIRRYDALDPDRYGCLLHASVDDATIPSRYLEGKAARNTSRFARMSVEAAGEAMADAGLLGDDLQPVIDLGAGGALFGTCAGGTFDDLLPAFTTLETRGPNRISPHLMVTFLGNLATFNVQARFGLGGPSNTIGTACATGAQAVGEAFHTVKYGRAPLMVAGAVESDRHPLAVAGFAAMRALVTDSNDCPENASRPFDATRAGFVIGEGAAVLILEELEHARARGARIYAEVLGFGSSNDAYHLIAPHPEGAGAIRAIRAALADGGIVPDQVDHINAHAASTPSGDVAEAVAIETVYGERASRIPVTSIKGAIGHCMGAAGAIETLIATLTIANSYIPPTRNYRNPDPEIHLDIVHGVARPAEVNVVAKHSFGLGGQNACLVLARVEG